MSEKSKRKRKGPKRSFRRRPIEETVKMYVDLLRGDYDEIMVPIFKFYRDSRWESEGWEDGEMVIMELQKAGYEVRQVVCKGILDRIYIKISR